MGTTTRAATLVVEDALVIARLHARLVSRHVGCRVLGAVTTGPAAIAAIRRLRPQLVLLDLHLPGCSGLDVLRAVRADGGAQPEVIAVTGARDAATVLEARRLGVQHYLVKPFGAAELERRIGDVLQRLPERTDADLDQSAIDALVHGGDRPDPQPPKGLSPATLAAVRGALDRVEGASATEIGERIGISRVSSRRYLEHLVATGRAERRLDYGAVGRPAAKYSAAG